MNLTLSSTCLHRPRWAACRGDRRFVALVAAGWLTACSLLMGCQRRDSASQERDVEPAGAEARGSADGNAHAHAGGHAGGHGHGHGHGHGRGHALGHDEESPSGAGFKAGRGVRLTDETRKRMGVEVADVEERAIPHWLGFQLQLFEERHEHEFAERGEHSGCAVHGAGFISLAAASNAATGQAVEISQGTNAVYGGAVLALRTSPALGELELVVGISNAVGRLKNGEFLPARLRLPSSSAVPAVPRSAVLRTSEGPFVYTVNGESYLRTPVRTGADSDGWVEILDGLLAGDAVVIQPVEALYLIELRATKGGGHSH